MSEERVPVKIHPRERITGRASTLLRKAIRDLQQFDLTDAEYTSVLMDVLANEILGHTKYLIREERHGDTETPGGLEIENDGGAGKSRG